MPISKITPARLATPTDLRADQVRAIVDSVNPLVADAYALYIKTKSFHWHVYGKNFRDYHRLFDEQADSIFSSIDILGERVRKLGMVTIRNIADIKDLSKISDCTELSLSPDKMIAELLSDNKSVAKSMRSAIEVCERNGDKVTSNIIQSLMDEVEKRIWFLFELTQ